MIDTATLTSLSESTTADSQRRMISGPGLDSLADIYQDDVNMAIWQRELTARLNGAARRMLDDKPDLQFSQTVAPDNCLEVVNSALGNNPDSLILATDIAELVAAFCYLFDIPRAGLRLSALGHAMCPRFHVDRVPCRLVTTYVGIATQWLPHQLIDRSKLGPGSQGMADHESGLYQDQGDIQQLASGEVALLKGESWEGNENAGLVHRSPQIEAGSKRLLLTLDFSIQ